MNGGATTTFPQTPHPTTAESERRLLLLTSGAAAVPRLRQLAEDGASAMDLALAAALTQVVLCGGAWSSLAGILSALHYDRRSGEICALDAGFDLPRGETAPGSIPGVGSPSGRGTLVPGFMAGVDAAHRRFGSLPWAQLFGPAIALAEEGVQIDKTLDALIGFRTDVLSRSADARSIFMQPDGGLLRAGSVLLQPALAQSLRATAAEGATYMHTGKWGRHLVAAVQAAGGNLSIEDLKEYRARWIAPLRTVYHGVEVVTIGPPQHGGLCLVEALNVLAAASWAELGHYTRSAQALLWLIRTSHLCYAGYLDNETPLAVRADPEWARALWSGLERHGGLRLVDRITGSFPVGRPEQHTDAIVAMDANGNIAVVAHSINTTAWGTTALFVDGVSIPDSGAFQQSLLLRVAPGERVPNALNPTMLQKDGNPFAAMAGIGGSVAEVMLQAVVNLVDFGKTPAEAARAPSILQSIWPSLGPFQWLLISFGTLLFALGSASAVALAAAVGSPLGWLATAMLVIAALLNLSFVVALLTAITRGWKAFLRILDAPWLIAGVGAASAAVTGLAWSAGALQATTGFFYLVSGVAAVLFVPTLRASLHPVSLAEPGDFDADLLKAVRRRGQPVTIIKHDPPRGFWIGAAFDTSTQRWSGAVSPRLWDGIALAL